jgi:hypothetical protein
MCNRYKLNDSLRATFNPSAKVFAVFTS